MLMSYMFKQVYAVSSKNIGTLLGVVLLNSAVLGLRDFHLFHYLTLCRLTTVRLDCLKAYIFVCAFVHCTIRKRFIHRRDILLQMPL